MVTCKGCNSIVTGFITAIELLLRNFAPQKTNEARLLVDSIEIAGIVRTTHLWHEDDERFITKDGRTITAKNP